MQDIHEFLADQKIRKFKFNGGVTVTLEDLVAEVRDRVSKRQGDDFDLTRYVRAMEIEAASVAIDAKIDKLEYEAEYAKHVNEVKDLKFKIHQLDEKVKDGESIRVKLAETIDKSAIKIKDLTDNLVASQNNYASSIKIRKDLEHTIEVYAKDKAFEIAECYDLIKTLKLRISGANSAYSGICCENDELKNDKMELSKGNADLKRALLIWVDKFVEKCKGMDTLSAKYEGSKQDCAALEEHAAKQYEKIIAAEHNSEELEERNQERYYEMRYWQEKAGETMDLPVEIANVKKDRDAWKARAEKLKADCEGIAGELKKVKGMPGGYWFILNRGAEFNIPENFDKDPIEAMAYLIAHKIQYHRLMAENFELRGIPPINDDELNKRCEEEAINGYKKLKNLVAQLDDKYNKNFWPGSTIEKCDPPSVCISHSHGLVVMPPLPDLEMCQDSPFYDIEESDPFNREYKDDKLGAPYHEDEDKLGIESRVVEIEKQFEDSFLIGPDVLGEYTSFSSNRMTSKHWDALSNPVKIAIINENLDKAEARKQVVKLQEDISEEEWKKERPGEGPVANYKRVVEYENFKRRNTFVDSLPPGTKREESVPFRLVGGALVPPDDCMENFVVNLPTEEWKNGAMSSGACKGEWKIENWGKDDLRIPVSAIKMSFS